MIKINKEILYEKIEKYYKSNDFSHDIVHVKKVADWANKIAEYEQLSECNKEIIEICSLYHDAYDHKYYNEFEIINIKNSIRADLTQVGLSCKQVDDIFTIIDNISFSKEARLRKLGKGLNLGKLQHIRNIVSDADKIEAVGDDSIKRMLHYKNAVIGMNTADNIKQHIDHIIDHCNKKLFILVDDNYIHSQYAIDLINEYVNNLKEIIYNRNILIEFIKSNI